MKKSTLIEVITPFGQGMYQWKTMSRPFQIGSSITCYFKNGEIELKVQLSENNIKTYQISPSQWLNGHEFAIADEFKIKFKGKPFQFNRQHSKHLEWNDFEIGKGGFFAAALMMGLATYLLPKEDQKTKVPEIEEIATIRLTTGESGLVAFSEPQKQPEPIVAAEPPAAAVAPVIEPAPAAPAPAPAKQIAAAPKQNAAPAPAAAPAPVAKAFSSKSGGKNQAGASVANVPAPNAAALLLSRRMASLQKGLQKVMTNPNGTGVVESGKGSSQNTSSLANSISSSETGTGGSVYSGMKNQAIAVTGKGSLTGGNYFELKNKEGRASASAIQMVQTTAPQVSGGELSVAIIQKTFQKNAYQLRNCYEAAKITTASIKLNLEFTILPTGGVKNQTFLQGPNRQPASIEQKNLETCILNQMANWKFETGQLKSSIVIEYPLTFRSLATGDE